MVPEMSLLQNPSLYSEHLCKSVNPHRHCATASTRKLSNRTKRAEHGNPSPQTKQKTNMAIKTTSLRRHWPNLAREKDITHWACTEVRMLKEMKRADESITKDFQEIHQTLVESWKPIFARWNGGEEPRYSDFEERFGQFIPNEPMDAKRITKVELRDRVQRWSNNAAAGADSWKRCEWKQFTDTMYDQDADYLNNIEEVACGLSFKELIESPILPEDIRTTPVANIKKEAESPGPRDVRSITLAATLHCAWSSTRYREAMTWAKNAWLTKLCTEESQVPEYKIPSDHSC